MSASLIILIIIILVLVLVLLFYVKGTKAAITNMNKDTVTINNADIVNPKSVRASYSMWIYVNSWGTVPKTICKSYENNTNYFQLYLDANTPTLKCDIMAGTPPTNNTVVVSNNFPVQRWVYIVISIDSNVVDCYLDGKLVRSQQLSGVANMSDDYSITTGNFDAYMTSFYRKPAASDPQSVWSTYMYGNGYTSNNLMSDYGFSFSVTKADKEIVGDKY